MEFYQKILERLDYIFKKNRLHIVEQRNNYLKLQSDNLIIIIIHNQFENSNMLFLGQNKKMHKVEIDNEVIKKIFDSDLKLSQVPIETFINNLAIFFENEAKTILLGDVNKIKQLEKFDYDRSKKYTQDLLEQQNLIIADEAWDKRDYKIFVKMIDEINLNKLPQSYQLKYRIAKQKLEK